MALLLFALSSTAYPQTTGKISGSVRDRNTGTALPGAIVFITGTNRGAAADPQGEFFIINLPPGSYDVEARMMGYSSTLIKDVRVAVNRTTPLDINLAATVIEGEVVTVQAEKMALKKDQTSSIRNISSEDIALLPVESVSTVIQMQPGVVGSHFRGGRSNEVTYLIDGISVTDAYNNNSQTSNVNPEVVEDVEVITGTFNAEYGNAMSGVVNVITKDGGNDFKGSISVNLGNYLTPHKDIYWGLSNGQFDRIQDLKNALSGPIIRDRLYFVGNFRYNKNKGPYNAVRHFRVDDYSNFSETDQESWHYEHTGDSTIVPFGFGDWYDLFGKLTFKAGSSIRLGASLTYNKGDGQAYAHQAIYNPDGHTGWHNATTMATLQLNYMLSKTAFYEVKASLSDYWTGNYLYENPLDSRYIHDQYRQLNGSWFETGGQDKGHYNRSELKYNLKGDFTWQVNKQHSLKSGFDFTRFKLDQSSYLIGNAYAGSGIENDFYLVPGGRDSLGDGSPAPNRTYPNYTPVLYGNESIYTDCFVVKPIQAAFYLQDKMEFNMMVVNLGIRFDYFDPRTVYPSNYRNPGNQTDIGNPERQSRYINADPKYQISPRLGLSYDLGGSALLRFAYGHFLQLPPMNYFYQNSAFTIGTDDYGTVIGNAQLHPQKTIQYEIGLYQQLTSQMNLEVAVWYKDIYDLVTATVFTTYNQRRYGIYTNKEYGNARGLEIKYDLHYNGLTAGLNYTWSHAKGVADNPSSTFDRLGNEQDPVNKLIPMSWDQRHTLNVSLGYNTKKFGASLLCFYNSNTPYSWSPITQSPLRAINLFPNNQYMPSKFSVDLNAYYDLASLHGVRFRVTLLVYNLLDRKNEEWVSSETGRAYSAIVQESDLASFHNAFAEYERTYQDPTAFAMPRQVKLGFGITF
jgi:outer membrane receptor protein involved in Fe transport